MSETRWIRIELPDAKTAMLYDSLLTGNDDDVVLAAERAIRQRVSDAMWDRANSIELSPTNEGPERERTAEELNRIVGRVVADGPLADDPPWLYDDDPKTVTLRLGCGHQVFASEDDGGLDELPTVSWRVLERIAMDRAARHAIVGCVGAS